MPKDAAQEEAGHVVQAGPVFRLKGIKEDKREGRGLAGINHWNG